MGMEDFGVLLRPTQTLSVSAVEQHLSSRGFVMNDPAFALSPNQSTYVLSDKDKNIEVLVKGNADDEGLTKYISIRYAVCQPETATEAFLDVVGQIAGKFCLQITGLAPGVEFSCDSLSEFQEYTWEKVKRAKSRWSSLFDGDTEEVVVSVAGSWKHFAAKHPEVFRSGPLSVK